MIEQLTKSIVAINCTGAWSIDSSNRKLILYSLRETVGRPITRRELACGNLSEDGYCLAKNREPFPLKVALCAFAMLEDISASLAYLVNPQLAPETTMDQIIRGKRCPFVEL